MCIRDRHNTNRTLKPRQFLLPCRLLLPYRFFCSTLKPRLVEYVQTYRFFCSTLKPRLVEHTADVYRRTDGTDFLGGMYQLETRFARIIYFFNYLRLHLTSVWQKRCILWLDFVASVGNFAFERVCWLYSVHERSSVFSWRMNTKIHPTENKATTCISIFLGNSGRRNEFLALALGWGFRNVYFGIRKDVNHHTCVVNLLRFHLSL